MYVSVQLNIIIIFMIISEINIQLNNYLFYFNYIFFFDFVYYMYKINKNSTTSEY